MEGESENFVEQATDAEEEVVKTKTVIEEILFVFSLAWPASAASTLWFLAAIVNTMFVGHIDRNTSLYLSGVSLATVYCNVTGWSIVMGLCSGLSTLGGQAYGAKQYELVGVLLQRTMWCVLLTCIPIAAIWWNAEAILVALKQEASVSKLAGQYLRYSIIGLPFGAIEQALITWLQAQNIFKVELYVGLAVNIVNPFITYALIFPLKLGFSGVAISTAINQLMATSTLVAIIAYNKYGKSTWKGWSRHGLREWGSLLKVAVPGMAMMCCEWWCFEILGAVAGYLPDSETSIATYGIVWQLIAICFMIVYGLRMAISTRCSNLLGAGEPALAKKSVLIGSAIALTYAFCVTIPIFALRHYIPNLWTGSARVRWLVADALPWMCLFEFLDLFQGVMSAAITGIGRQDLGSTINILAYWALGLPLVYLFSFHLKRGVKGMLHANLVSSGLVCACLIVFVSRINWHLASQKAKQNSQQQAQSLQQPPTNQPLLPPTD